MEKKATKRLAGDIRISLHEALDHARGRRTNAIVHRVTPLGTDARKARTKLGLTQSEAEPIAVRRTLAKVVCRRSSRKQIAVEGDSP